MTYFLLSLLVAFAVLFGSLMTSDKGRRSFGLALRSLWLHKLRSSLSVLGIVIGTAAVIALMAFGKGSMEDALEDIRRQGTTNVILRSVKPTDDTSNTSGRRSWIAKYGLTWDDYDRCSPEMLSTVVGRVPMRIIPSDVSRLGGIQWNRRVIATTAAFADVAGLKLATGRFLNEQDETEMTNRRCWARTLPRNCLGTRMRWANRSAWATTSTGWWASSASGRWASQASARIG